MVLFGQFLRKHRMFFFSMALVVLILAAFEPLRHNQFIAFDDDGYITDNPHIQSGITFRSLVWAFTTGRQANWHPLTWLSHMLDIEFFGLNPTGHHLHNLVLHITVTVLLFWILSSMTGAFWTSAFAAAVFGLHPLHVESIAWTAERKDVLCGLFWMLTMSAYFGYARRGGISRYLLVVLCFALGLMAKPMIVTLPIVLLLLDYWPLGRLRTSMSDDHRCHCRPLSLSRLIIEKIPFFFLTLTSCIVTFLVQQRGGAVHEQVPFMYRIMNAIVSYANYLHKMIWPNNLAVLYPYPVGGLHAWQVCGSFSLVVIISGLAVIYRTRWPYWAVGWLWYMGTLVPVIGLVKVGSQAMADRYLYLPSIGIIIMVSWAAAELTTTWRFRKIILTTLSVMLLIAMTAVTRNQTCRWKDSTTLFEHALSITKDNYMIHNNLGSVLLTQGKIDEAGNHFEKALQMCPQYGRAHFNLGFVRAKQGKLQEAEEHFRQNIEIQPHEKAYQYLSTILAQQGRLEEAVAQCRIALKNDSDDYETWNLLGQWLHAQGNFQEAIDAFLQALKLKSDSADVYCSLGMTYEAQKRYDDATHAYEKAMQYDPNDFQAFYQSGALKAKQGLLDDAVSCYRTALKIKPNVYEAWSKLGNCLRMQEKIQDALYAYRQALKIKPDFVPVLNNLAWLLSTILDQRFRNPTEAIQLAQTACELTSFQDITLLDTLATAYANAGQFKQAIETVHKAIALPKGNGQTKLVEDLYKKLRLFQTGHAYSEPP